MITSLQGNHALVEVLFPVLLLTKAYSGGGWVEVLVEVLFFLCL
jgi:hypothetical protein